MVELLPSWMQENCYPAQYDRLMLGNLVGVEGVAERTEGALLVTTGGSGLNVSVAQGGAWVEGDDDDRGMYSVYNDAAVTLTATAADPTNPRIDTVVARVYDSTYGEGADEWQLEILAGTPTGGATLTNLTGAASVSGINALVLAYVLVPATFTGPFVNATHIRDVRRGYKPASSMSTGSLVRVHRGAAFSVATAVPTDLIFDNVTFGNEQLYSTTTGVYTTPETGFYRVSYSILALASAAIRNETQVVVGGSGTTICYGLYGSASTMSTGNSVTLSVAAGTAIKIQWAASSGTLTGTVGSANTYASFERIG